MFAVVSELPTEDIKEGKIYCIKDTSSTAQDNGYIEYAYINNKWEKIGQFQAEPDLSGYAKLSGAKFTGTVDVGGYLFSQVCNPNTFRTNYISYTTKGNYLKSAHSIDMSPTKTYTTDGKLADIGTEESFVFTLEDGSTVTKSIRVISTTSQAEA